MTIKTKSFPRAALIGNPSDGYFGKTIAFLFSNFSVTVELSESRELTLIPGSRDRLSFENIENLCEDIHTYGYYGGIRLIKAAIKKFADYCRDQRIDLPDRNFTIKYHSDIPQRLGLAGSSAIITAVFKAVMEYYQVDIPKPILSNLVLASESEELSIAAGLQDRVAQVYEAPIFMDFDQNLMKKQGYGYYEAFSKDLLPDLYIAYRSDLSEGSEVVHNDLRERFNARHPDVLDAMEKFGNLTTRAFNALKNKDPEKLGPLMNANFDLRRSIVNIGSKNEEMVELARSLGASAKFTGSGGAIIGTYASESMYEQLAETLKSKDIEILKPKIVENGES